MTLQEIQQTDWYKTRPTIIKEAINILPPIGLYKFKDSGKQCVIRSYEEPNDKNKEVTVTVVKTGIGGVLATMGISQLEKNQGVFGVSLNDLELWN